MQVLTETIIPGTERPLIVERKDEQNEKFYYLKGLFLEGEYKNHNGRWYPRGEIEKAVNRLQKRIRANGPVPGELDHPAQLNINFDRIAVAITEMHMEGTNGFGTMRVVPAGCGLILQGAIRAGIQVAVSRRGSGDVDHEGKVRDFDIVTIDAVINPRAEHARPRARLAERLDRHRRGREVVKLLEYVRDDARAQRWLQRRMTELFVRMRDDKRRTTWTRS